MADVADFPLLTLNSDFSCRAENRTVSSKRAGTITLFEMERMESSTRSLFEANFYSLWLLSGLLSQLKSDGFAPSDLALFDSAISSLSTFLAGQTRTSAELTDFIVSKRRESYLGHASLLLSAAQKCDLLITPGSDTTLFDQALLEEVSGQVNPTMVDVQDCNVNSRPGSHRPEEELI